MMNKKIFGFTLAVLTIAFVTGCYKDRVVPLSASGQTVVITKTVTFTNDILPIFTKNCALSGCHASGGKKPDLSAGSAYYSLTSGNYYSKSTPETSEIYQWLTGKRGTQMPISGLDPTINAMVLAWIKQGAKNN